MRKRRWFGIVTGVVAAGVLTLGALALAAPAGAQTPDDGGPHERYLEQLAQQLGVSVDQLKEAQKAARDQVIDDAVAKGVITPETAAKLKERPVGALRRIGGFVRGALHGIFDAAADVLGKSREDVVEGLRNGESLSEQAAAQGMSRDELTSGIQTHIEEQLRQAVANGRISQEVADRMLQALDERIDTLIDRAPEPGSQPQMERFRFNRR